MQYPLASMQNQAAYHNMVPPVNQGNSLRGLSPELSPGTLPRTYASIQSAGYTGSPYPAMPGQYPVSYPGGFINNRSLGDSHSSDKTVSMNANSASASSASTSSGGQIEG